MSQSKRFSEHDNEFSVLQWPSQSLDLNPVEHLWDVIEQEIHSMKVHLENLQELHDAESQRNVSNILWNPCHEEMRLFCVSNPGPGEIPSFRN